MRSRALVFTLGVLFGALVGLSGCGDSSDTKPDGGGGGDGNTLADGQGPLRACTTPGQPCAAHTSCAINPVCGDDLKCRPTAYQNCDDGLACTDDVCLGQGKCENKPKDGTCALLVRDGNKSVTKCFKKGDRSPDRTCQVCDPDTDKIKWTPANGGTCDDGDSCTKDDYCDNGACKGTPFGTSCDDKLTCTIDECDGKGGCLKPKLASGTCLIGGKCYKDGDRESPATCNFCDVKTSQTAWTKPAQTCQINGLCYRPGDRSADGCGECDPSKSTVAWTILTDICTIAGKCYKRGEANTKATCAVCDPTANATGWSVPGSECFVGGKCHKPGDKSPSGCGTCTPSKIKTEWTPDANKCEIDGVCYSPGDKNTKQGGCAECDPAVSATKWTVKGNDCLIDKKCYKPAALKSNGCATCEPTKSKTEWTLKAGLCEIDGVCYPSGDKNTPQGGCGTCVPSTSQTAWTVTGNDCLINNKCYAANASNASGCGTCQPSVSKSQFTALTTVCTIGGLCYQPGAASPSGCGTCDPTKDPSDWTPVANKCEIAGKCYNPGDTHPGNCGTCDPTKDPKGWTVTGSGCLINDACVASGTKDPIGCSTCDPTKSKTNWTPTAGCWVIVIAALNEAYTGKLGGTAGADALCQKQASAAGLPGSWKALLGSSTRTMKSLITGTDATTRKVVNLAGQQMYSSWNDIFTCTTTYCTWASNVDVTTFKGRVIEENEPQPACKGSGPACFYDADFWHGTLKNGTSSTDTCKDWTSDSSSDDGAVGEGDFWEMFNSETDSCDKSAAVFCVQVGA